MASPSFETKVQKDILQCPICCAQFCNPKVLRCQHSFCYGCLKGYLATAKPSNKKAIKCAVCRKSTPIGKKGVDDLPDNFVINGLMQMVRETGSPSNNKENIAKSSSYSSSKGLGAKLMSKGLEAKLKKIKKSDLKPSPSTALKVVQLMDKNQNQRKKINKKDFDEDSTSSSESSSEDESDSSGSYCEDSGSPEEFTPGGSSSDSDDGGSSASSEEVCPPTPTLKSSMGVKKGMKICVFTEKGKPCPAVVRVLERFKRKAPGQSRVYAGIELERENSRLTTSDMEDMDDSYLFHWMMDYEFPSAVVRVDQCCPASLIDDLCKKGSKCCKK